MKHHGRVTGVDASGAALVELEPISQCARCRRGEGCGSVFFDTPRPGITLRVTQAQALPAITGESSTVNDMGGSVGQSVVIEIEDSESSQWLLPVLGAYGLPLLGMLLATGTLSALTGALQGVNSVELHSYWAELVVLAGAGLGLCGGLFAWRSLSSNYLGRVLADAERSLCLQSARIVAIEPSSK